MSRSEPPLLLLADGRGARPRKASTVRPREIALHLSVVDVLRKLGNRAWRWSHFPAGEVRDARTGAKLKRMGTARGWADILLVSPRGILHSLELKRLGESLTEDQEAFQVWACRHGIPYSVASSLDEAICILAAWGAIVPIAGGRG